MGDFPYLLEGVTYTLKQLAAVSRLSTHRVQRVVAEFHPTSLSDLKACAVKQLQRPLPRLTHASKHTQFNIKVNHD